MNHLSPSPIFDIPEFPPLRRLKPLPKRRRTSGQASEGVNNIVLPISATLNTESFSDDLISPADSLTTQMALQSFYMPTLSGIQDLLELEESVVSEPINLDLGYGIMDGRLTHGADYGDGDYVDHLQQPGNTKKRKVPANASGSMHGREAVLGSEDDSLGAGSFLPGGRSDQNIFDLLNASPPPRTLLQKKGKLTASTRAALQHKEMLRHRKRQLQAVLGALTHGDPLALEQALSSQYPLSHNGLVGKLKEGGTVHVRLSRRRGPRLARLAKAALSFPSQQIAFPTCEFTFVRRSDTSDRLNATKEEVTLLRSRFEAELAHQAAKATKVAAEGKQGPTPSGKGRKSDKAQNRTPNVNNELDDHAISPDSTLAGSKTRESKKKKRSTLAITANPHHRKNYVPSRLPNSGHANFAQASLNAQNSLAAFPLRFLSAEIPPRRRKLQNSNTPLAQIIDPVDEWICPFCEYRLFYGGGPEYRRSIRDRKKILRRRRRARERAAGGLSVPKISERPASQKESYDDVFESQSVDLGADARDLDWRGRVDGEETREENYSGTSLGQAFE